MAAPSVGIVGAGVAAASCARALASVGIRSTVYEQGRSAGGPLATRGSRSGAYKVNHGAPAFTASGPEFRKMIAALEVEGAAQEWTDCTLGVLDGRRRGNRRGLALVEPAGLRLYRGQPTQASLPVHLLEQAAPHCEPRFGTAIERMAYDGTERRWRLTPRGGGAEMEHEYLVVSSSLPANSERWSGLFGVEAPLVSAAAGSSSPELQAAVAAVGLATSKPVLTRFMQKRRFFNRK